MGHVCPSVCPSSCPLPSWSSVLPFLFDGKIPFPRQAVGLVIICQEGLDVASTPSKHAFEGLLHGDQEFRLLSPGPIAPNHVAILFSVDPFPVCTPMYFMPDTISLFIQKEVFFSRTPHLPSTLMTVPRNSSDNLSGPVPEDLGRGCTPRSEDHNHLGDTGVCRDSHSAW